MDFSINTKPPLPQQDPIVTIAVTQQQKLVGARKRKPTTISKISSNSQSPEKSPHHFRDDEDENESYSSDMDRRNSAEPNNNKIQSILSELKFAKQRNKLEEFGKESGGRGGRGGRRSPTGVNHFGGGVFEVDSGGSRGGSGGQDKPILNGSLRLPPPPHLMMLPAHAHTQPKHAHLSTRTSVTSTLLQDEPLDLTVDAVDLRKGNEGQNLALMMMMMGGSDRGDKRFTKPHPTTLPSPPPSPPPNIPMDLTSTPRVTKYTDKVLMIGGKLDHIPTTTHHHGLEFNDKVSSSFGSPPSSIGSNQAQDHSDGGSGTQKRKYQKRRVDSEHASGQQERRKQGGGGNGGTTPSGVKPKQRRYRTERPFHCPHCPARFTLRSNMERHGKHQHATVWQRSPSNRVLNKQRALQAQQQSTAGSSTSSPPPRDLTPVLTQGTPQQHNNIRLVLSQQLKRKLSNLESADLASVETLLEKTGNEDFKKYFRGIAGEEEDGYDDDEGDEDGMMGEEEEDVGDDRIDEYDDERFREDFYEEDEVQVEEIPDQRSGGKRNLRSRSRATGGSAQGTPVQTQQKSLSAYSSAPHKISCPHCTRKFPWTSSLRRHLLTHTGQKPFQCSHCPLLFTTKSNCDRHVARKHSSEGGAVTIILPETPSGSGSSNAILRGKLSEKKDEDVEEIEEDLLEEDEDDDYEGIVSKIKVEGEMEGKEVLAEKEKVTGGGASFRCHLCELSSPIRSVILKHIESTHSDNYALLDVVGGADEMEQDDGTGCVGNVTNRKVLCAFCIRRFWSVEDLRRHMRSHTGERPFSCQYCSRRFSLKHSLLRHMKKHGLEAEEK